MPFIGDEAFLNLAEIVLYRNCSKIQDELGNVLFIYLF